MLSEFDTTVAANSSSPWLNLLPEGLKKEWLRRTYAIPADQIVSHPLKELARILLPKAGLRKLVEHETGWASVDAVYKDLDKKVAARIARMNKSDLPNSVYAYEDGALASFKQAKQAGIRCIYDLPIGYWRAARELLSAERERWPDWADTLTGFKDSDAKLNRKDEELKLADDIFVASSFTAKTLSYFPGELPAVNIIPYGFPPVAKERSYPVIMGVRKLKLLFVGGLSQRKGIADLFEAVKAFGDKVELTIVGSKLVNNCAVLNEELKKYRWIPSLPHTGVLKLMHEHDVLLFPSLFEGFGLVITEAMAQGTPVITTDRTAGPDIITNGEDGWIIAAGSTGSLHDAIENILINPGLIAKVGEAARGTAQKRPWELYGQELVKSIIHIN